MSNDKKSIQLGMNASTASGRLTRDILFKLVSDAGHLCYQCGKKMTRESFSIEHKVAWLDTDNPVFNYFDLNNISFSHKSCNYKAARKVTKKYHTHDAKKAGHAKNQRVTWSKLTKEKQKTIRREKYLKYGK